MLLATMYSHAYAPHREGALNKSEKEAVREMVKLGNKAALPANKQLDTGELNRIIDYVSKKPVHYACTKHTDVCDKKACLLRSLGKVQTMLQDTYSIKNVRFYGKREHDEEGSWEIDISLGGSNIRTIYVGASEDLTSQSFMAKAFMKKHIVWQPMKLQVYNNFIQDIINLAEFNKLETGSTKRDQIVIAVIDFVESNHIEKGTGQ